MRDEGGAAETALPLPGLAVQDVLLERLAPQKLPVLGPLEALGCAAVCLQLDLFRHLPLTLNHALRQAQDERSWTSSQANVAANEASSSVPQPPRSLYLVAVAAAALALPPPLCGRRVRMVCIWLPSIRGVVSGMATSVSSWIRRSRMRRPISGCAISRPRKKIVALTLSPSSRKRSMCFFLNW